MAGMTIPTPAMGHTGSTGIARTAAGVGKPGRTEHLGNLASPPGRAPRTTISGGDPGAHGMSHYGKAPSANMFGTIQGGVGGVQPTAHAGTTMIRGSGGKIRPHVRQGGLGPGRDSAAGADNTNYSMNSIDQE